MSMSIRSGVVLWLLFLAFGSSVAVRAQSIEIVSTISERDASTDDLTGSSAGIVVRWLKRLADNDRAHWSFTAAQPCTALDTALKRDPVVVLTTSECWDHVRFDKELTFSASVGMPVYVYSLTDNSGRGIYPNANVAILMSAQGMLDRIQSALDALSNGRVNVAVVGRQESELLQVLKSGTYGLVAIPEDGSGRLINAFLQAAQKDRVKVSSALYSAYGPLPTSGGARVLLLPARSIPELVLTKDSASLPNVLMFPLPTPCMVIAAMCLSRGWAGPSQPACRQRHLQRLPLGASCRCALSCQS